MRLGSLALLGCLTLSGCAAGGVSASDGGQGGFTATATLAASPTPTTAPTTCAQVVGFAGATALTLPNMELPAGATAPTPTRSGGGPGQYTFTAYTICVPNNTSDLNVNSGKGPEAFTHLLPFYGWASWQEFPSSIAGQMLCNPDCFAFHVDDASRGLFNGTPRFLSLEQVTPLANGLVTFTLRIAQAAAPACGGMFDTSDQATYGHAPEYALYYFFGGPGASIQLEWPPMTRSAGDSTPSAVGQDLCSAGTAASVKAFMDSQFAALNFTRVACTAKGNDCWEKAGETVTMNITSASDWTLSTPRGQPQP